MRLAHVNIRISDAAASLAFYNHLELSLVGCLVISQQYYLLYLGTAEDDQTTIELTVNEAAGAEYDRSPGSGHFALAVGDLDALLARLGNAGIFPEQWPFHPAGSSGPRICFVVDPDGHRVELVDGTFPTPSDARPETLAALPDQS